MMKLSIIVPVYNVEQYIHECLTSIYSQNIPISTYEVLVVNDGTPDNSMSIVQEFLNKYSNLKIINQSNQGLSMARNNGLRVAEGEYIWFIDSDDWIKTDCFNYIISLVEKYKPDILSMPLNYCYEQKNKINKLDFSISNISFITGKDYLFNKYPYGATQRYIIKRTFLIKNNLYFQPNLLHEDNVFGAKTLYLSESVCVLNQSFYNYRIRNSGSIMSSWKKKNSDDIIIGYKLLEKFSNDFIIDEIEKSKFANVIIDYLVATVIFARGKWITNDFFTFYWQNRNYIATKGLMSFRDNNINLKYRLKGMLIFISPFIFCFVISLILKFKENVTHRKD